MRYRFFVPYASAARSPTAATSPPARRSNIRTCVIGSYDAARGTAWQGAGAQRAHRSRFAEPAATRPDLEMKHIAAAAILAMGIGLAALPTPAPAQSPPAGETRSVPFGATAFVLHVPPAHCLVDARQPAEAQLESQFFRPRAGQKNTYLGAFVECKQLAAVRSNPSALVLSFGYYLAVTATANQPVAQPREQYLRGLCQRFRSSHGSLDFANAADAAKRDIEARMQALAIGPPQFGPVVGEDAKGCYQLILNKRPLMGGLVHREVSLSIVTLVKGRPLIYTRTMPYLNATTVDFLRTWVPRELATFLASNR